MPATRSQALWCLAQIAFIAALTHGMSVPPEGYNVPINPAQVMVSFGVSVIMAAFFTALITRLWDRANAKLRGLTGITVPAAGTACAEHHEPVQEADRAGARLGVREIRKTPSSLWRGQQRG
ncbi:hypothetical protein BGCPKDLD_2475 [Methylorubrum suomiense]|uniref:Uncharacterized protein n=1 Tax=Methylorubrum suomiense TaxID=144191 RepID=A0ABQ4UU75_9HYPH|nr:hypothetical protein BGCPKDLD_2475 [Methylorubrum suomiense]